MDSLMFTFSADHSSLQIGLDHKRPDSTSKSFRRRPSSSKTAVFDKTTLSPNRHQLFENCHFQDTPHDSTPSKNIHTLKLKNSSIQIQEKKKLRNIIDSMLGKNFDTTQSHKIDSIVVSNRKNLNKHRTYLNQTKKSSEKQLPFNGSSSKQNQLNSQNIVFKSETQNQDENPIDKRIKIKLKKYEFANLKLSKMANHSQRYPEISNDDEEENIGRRLANISRESIDRESLGKKALRNKTPKIMYPDSDSKLPSVFRNPNMRSSFGESLKKRSRMTSAHLISQTGKEINQNSVLIKKKRTLENSSNVDPSFKLNFRPQSTMLSSKRYSSSTQREQKLGSSYHPKRLIFDCNQDLMGEQISKKLGANFIETKGSGLRVSTRAKSTHVNYVHRKLREMSTMVNEPLTCENEQRICVKNESLHSRQTAQASDFQESTEKTLPNFSDKLTKSIQQREVAFIGGLSNCVTFQVQKA